MLIVNAIPHELGWSPVQHMIAIAGELLDCEVVTADKSRPSTTTKVLSVLRKRTRNGANDEACLLVCTGPADLLTLLNIENWRKRFRYLAAWIIDSFWLDHIPRSIRLANPFDHIFVTTLEDVDRWRQITGVPTTWLPWGSDVLRLGHGGAAHRDWDLTRVGRQPPEWEDDLDAASAAESLGIRYRGRPDRSRVNSLQNQKLMMNVYGASKFILAFSNAVNCDPNNHPTRELELHARVVVLSAGALHTPQILLRSRSDFWPRGLANSSDQVGRNLMFHTSEIFALFAPRRLSRQGRQRKAISVRDFYVHEGRRLGYVQSMGLEAGRGEIAAYIKDRLRGRGVRHELLLSLLAKAPSHIGALMFGSAGIFAAMTEDDPNPNNRIVLDPAEPDGASFSYTITDELRQRANELRLAFARGVRPWRMLRISPGLAVNYGHPCGTCRFGADPAASVLDGDCRTHDLENLYVVDSSFMPRSGAMNPSLTIAANALRVAPRIAARLSNSDPGSDWRESRPHNENLKDSYE